MTRTLSLLIVIASCVLLPAGSHAHHSRSEYDRTTVEIEGKLVDVAWRNPHVHFVVRTTEPNGKVLTWDIEAN